MHDSPPCLTEMRYFRPADREWTSRSRAWALAVVLWAFGLATTTLLVGVWGRSVVTNQQTLSGTAQALLGADVVSEGVFRWLRTGLATVSVAAGPEVDAAVRAAAESPEAERAVEVVVDEIVAAAVAPPGSDVRIDFSGAMQPVVPILAAALSERGVDVSDEVVGEAVSRLSVIVIDESRQAGISGIAHRARSTLTIVVVAGMAAVSVFGGLAISLSEQRAEMVRTLATRMMVSAITFVLFLRIGAWAVDPQRGRAPAADAAAALLGGGSAVLVFVAAMAGLVALSAGWAVRRRRRSGFASGGERSAG